MERLWQSVPWWLLLGFTLTLLLGLAGCRWCGKCESELTVHQPTATAGLVPQDGDK